jgi:resuscitation-promoting factor RpfB
MDGNKRERGRHRRGARTDHPSTVGNPQWSDGSSDRPQWTAPDEPRSWFEKQASGPAVEPAAGGAGAGDRWRQAAADNAASWRPASDLTDTAWGLDGAWRDPSAQWNVAGVAPNAGTQQTHVDPNAVGLRWDAGRDDRTGAAGDRRWDSGEQHWNAGQQGRTAAAGWERNSWDDRAAWDAGAEPDGRAGWDRETAWGAGQGFGSLAGWDDALTDTASTGSPVALLERPRSAPVPDAPEQDAPAPERKHTVRHPLRIGLFALVLFGLVAGSVAWLSMDKSVTLTVDGEARAVKTYASTVGGVLDDQKITVGGHDTLAPARETRISDGAEIVLRRGRLITLTVDGQTRQVWTTGTTVQDALDQIGYRQANLWTSSDRSTRLPLDGYRLTLRMPKSVTIVADGTKRTITTTAATVGAALDQAGIDIGANDTLSPLSTAPVRAGMTITLSRLTTKTATTEAVVEYKTVEKTDPDADPGSRTVQTKGVTGLQQVTTVMTYVNGKLTSSKVTKRVVVKKPVDEVVVVGPTAAPPVSQPAGCADFPTTGGLNWCGLAQCESGLNPNAYNPAGPYYGLYQFDQQTWQANGGTGTPSGKSIAEQTRVAYNLYQARGRAPWPVCGKNL